MTVAGSRVRLLGLLLVLLPSWVSADVFVRDDIITDPDPEAFSICYNHTCKEVTTVSLDRRQWRKVQTVFAPPATSGAQERRQVAEALALFEQMVGGLVGTGLDRGGNFQGMLSGGKQQDCIDESTNTTTFLAMLEKEGLLRWHSVEDRSSRGFFIFGMPHTTAVVKDNVTGEKWAVDSWFHDNGVPPEIIPLSEWRGGWEPQVAR
jgi:hypothetical protein